jgi:hypothetical protein
MPFFDTAFRAFGASCLQRIGLATLRSRASTQPLRDIGRLGLRYVGRVATHRLGVGHDRLKDRSTLKVNDGNLELLVWSR